MKSQYGEFPVDIPRDRNGKHYEEVDTAVSQLGSDAKPTDDPVSGKDPDVSINMKRASGLAIAIRPLETLYFRHL